MLVFLVGVPRQLAGSGFSLQSFYRRKASKKYFRFNP
jgi:hypothetical protein